MNKIIVFDFGGVITLKSGWFDLLESLCENRGIPSQDIIDLSVRIWEEVKTGGDSKKFWKIIAKRLDITWEELKNLFLSEDKVNVKVVEIIKKLKLKNYKLILLSNHIEDWLETVMEKEDMKKYFFKIITSYNSGLSKPNSKIYRRVIQIMECEFKDLIFIDDNEANISSALKCGINCIKYKNSSQLQKDLIKSNINF